jgi:hypothetical protein
MPLLMIYGREDRARAFERATLLQQRNPELNLHFAPGCRRLVPWPPTFSISWRCRS